MNLLRISCLLLLISLGWGAGGGFGPATASASCGDYVHLGNGRGTAAAGSAGNLAQDLAGGFAGIQDRSGADALPESHSSPSPGSQRCQGPACRGALPSAPPTPPLETSSRTRELLGAAASDLDRESCVGLVPGESERLAAKRREGRWERPPRS